MFDYCRSLLQCRLLRTKCLLLGVKLGRPGMILLPMSTIVGLCRVRRGSLKMNLMLQLNLLGSHLFPSDILLDPSTSCLDPSTSCLHPSTSVSTSPCLFPALLVLLTVGLRSTFDSPVGVDFYHADLTWAASHCPASTVISLAASAISLNRFCKMF